MSNDTLFVFDSESNNSLEFMQNCWHEEDVIPRLHDTTGCETVQPVLQPVECLYTRYNRLLSRFTTVLTTGCIV